MSADGFHAARRAAAGVFFGLLAGVVLAWAGLTVVAVTGPGPVSSVRAGAPCPAPSPRARPGQNGQDRLARDCRRVRPPGRMPGRPQPPSDGRPQPPPDGRPR